MMNRFILYFFAQLISLCLFAERTPKIEKQPTWITLTKIDYSRTELDDEAEDGYSDLSYERQVSLELNAVFYKSVTHILSETGVENQSQISIDYDPSFQELVFHSVKIIRGSEVIDQLQLSKIKTIQQEKELSMSLYNGSLTAIIILEDVRKGDIIEYSYTLKGFNPIFKNKYADDFTAQFSVPIYNVFYKLIVPKNRNLTIKNNGTTVQPQVSNLPNAVCYDWQLSNTKALHTDDNVPSWYESYPTIMVSEFKSWKEVADWALELFPFSASLSGGLKKKADEIKAMYKEEKDQVLAALHFVQDDVRYMGIEMGEHSHKPHSPQQILEQRFGDCKDKAYLLCTLLRGLNIEAYPVLNNTDYKNTINNWLPTPYAFNHTTACVKLNGKTYWFDATISFQRGSLDDISYPDYQSGLVIQPNTASLTQIPFQKKGKVVSKETFYVNELNGPVRFIVVTSFSGSYAENIRYSFKNNSLQELQKSYKGLYSPYFKKIVADSLRYFENEESGTFTTKEFYTINDFWEEDKGKSRVLIEPYFINSIIRKPKEEDRNMPFAISYPATYEESIEIRMPQAWPVEEAGFRFETNSFNLNYDYSQPSDNIILLRYSYESKADHVLPSETAAYLKELKEADKTIAFEITNNNDVTGFTTSKDRYNKGFTAAYVLLSACGLATYFYRRKKRRTNYW